MLRKLKAELERISGVKFRGLETFRSTFVQQSIDALVAMGYKESAAAEVVMSATGHSRLETVLDHDGRIKKQDALALLREARKQAKLAQVVGAGQG